jgi:hypothetical protein
MPLANLRKNERRDASSDNATSDASTSASTSSVKGMSYRSRSMHISPFSHLYSLEDFAIPNFLAFANAYSLQDREQPAIL